MSNLAIAHFLQSFFDWRSIYAPRPGKRRYCPVLKTRGQPAQYLEKKHDQTQSALVAKNDTALDLVTDLETGTDQDDLIDYIRDAIPELEPREAANAVVFHEVTDKDLPPCSFMTGDTLVWNDTFIPPGHPARVHCGEGPFKVVRDETYLVAFTKDAHHSRPTNYNVGNNRVVLQNQRDQTLIIAHGSLFSEAKVGTTGVFNTPADKLLEAYSEPSAQTKTTTTYP